MPIDLRSDTVTLPTAQMMRAIAEAPLGDDVYGEDPTVAQLERAAAERMGHEAGLFFPSGTMANLCACLTHSERGKRLVCGDLSHLFLYEAGGAAVLGGLIYHPIANQEDGGLKLDAFDAVLEMHDKASVDHHLAPVGLVALETTHNRCGGVPVPLAVIDAIVERARARGIPVHLDGARLFNAAVALAVPVRELARRFDSVQLCLSKGLAAPVGSLLVGTGGFIGRARRLRKMLGGGMRQSGILAAAGRVALEAMPARLGEDHAMARTLAQSLVQALGERVEVRPPLTNIVLFRPTKVSCERVIAAAKKDGILVSQMGPWIRAVTHHGIDAPQLEQALRALIAAFAVEA